jgi:hypothetical protein
MAGHCGDGVKPIRLSPGIKLPGAEPFSRQRSNPLRLSTPFGPLLLAKAIWRRPRHHRPESHNQRLGDDRNRRSAKGFHGGAGRRPDGCAGMILREVAIVISAGLALGLPMGLGMLRCVRARLYNVKVDAPRAWSGAVAIAVITLFAGLLPPRKATRIDPASTLRWDLSGRTPGCICRQTICMPS